MIRLVVESALKSKADEVVVVLGWQADKIRKVLADLPCRLVLNVNYEKGQSSSVKAGLREVGNSAQAILVLPGDVAKIDSRSINLVIEEHYRSSSPIIISAHNGRLGHPILLSRGLFTEIEQIDEETHGLKAVVKRHGSEIRLVECGSESVLRDVDVPEDLEQL